ncbi:hypothetical protein SGUI_1773 [Serinicoccus hydrothermalis]|uniref:Uncharacterized protein n=1 Tax=Serinicoccus hydrothermalis TaxID=1758689 RepID=A0A1B1NCK2_9MICO|nr:hypothetical protein [Serinicoccus hydrothermalis]ANS79169.1 hypothetical protein SGUI_1773 [Serinicoccus hydrothermalis]
MPQIDIEATRAAARALRDGGAALEGATDDVAVAGLAGALRGSATESALADLQSTGRLRLSDAGRELSTLAEGMVTLADHTAEATGER